MPEYDLNWNPYILIEIPIHFQFSISQSLNFDYLQITYLSHKQKMEINGFGIDMLKTSIDVNVCTQTT